MQVKVAQMASSLVPIIFGTPLAMWLPPAAAFAQDKAVIRDAETAGISPPGAGASESQVFALSLAGGRHQIVLYMRPSHVRATIVMLPGGAGDVGIQKNGDIQHGENFLVRTRDLWVGSGYALLIPDTPDGIDLRGMRSSSRYAGIVESLIAFASTKSPGPIFLLGTSQGTIAAMNGAAHAQAGALAGVVLTESVSRMGDSRETVFDADPQDVRVPALIVANQDDHCDVAPAEDAARIAASMIHSPDVRVLRVAGGKDVSKRACGPLTPHGYYDIETEIVDAIDQWMRAHS